MGPAKILAVCGVVPCWARYAASLVVLGAVCGVLGGPGRGIKPCGDRPGDRHGDLSLVVLGAVPCGDRPGDRCGDRPGD